MNKYSLEYLDVKMIFNQAIFESISGSVPFSCRLIRMDDFELSMEIGSIEEIDILPLHDILNTTMSVFATHFWNASINNFMEMPVTSIPFDLRIPISIDIILIKSSSREIRAEFFIYQGPVNSYDAVLKIQSV